MASNANTIRSRVVLSTGFLRPERAEGKFLGGRGPRRPLGHSAGIEADVPPLPPAVFDGIEVGADRVGPLRGFRRGGDFQKVFAQGIELGGLEPV